MIFEFCALGTIKEHIKKVNGYSLKEVAFIIKQVLLAVSALHDNTEDGEGKPIIHRDIKTDNILVYDIDIARGPLIKLADFGYAKEVQDSGKETTILGTRLCMAPELVNKQEYDEEIDIWAVGVLAFFLISNGKYPFPGISKPVVNEKILREEPEMA